MASSMVSGMLTSALSQALPQALEAVLQQWQSHTRLYTLAVPGQAQGALADLMVEGFVLVDDLSQPYTLHLHTLSRDATLPLEQLLVAYQRGASLLGFCRERLQAVEDQVKQLEGGQLKPWDAA